MFRRILCPGQVGRNILQGRPLSHRKSEYQAGALSRDWVRTTAGFDRCVHDTGLMADRHMWVEMSGRLHGKSVEKAPCTDLRSDQTLLQNSYRTTQADAYVNHAHQTQAQSVNSQT